MFPVELDPSREKNSAAKAIFRDVGRLTSEAAPVAGVVDGARDCGLATGGAIAAILAGSAVDWRIVEIDSTLSAGAGSGARRGAARGLDEADLAATYSTISMGGARVARFIGDGRTATRSRDDQGDRVARPRVYGRNRDYPARGFRRRAN